MYHWASYENFVNEVGLFVHEHLFMRKYRLQWIYIKIYADVSNFIKIVNSGPVYEYVFCFKVVSTA